MDKILINGCSGYLGARLARKLLESGREIVALTHINRFVPPSEFAQQVKSYKISEVPIEEILKKEHVETVINTATAYARNGESISDILDANLVFPLKLLDAAANCGVKYFLNTATDLPETLNSYSLSKHQFGHWLDLYSEKIKCAEIRFDQFYGPNDSPVKFVGFLLSELKNNVEKIELTKGTQFRNFIYIDDVIDAYSTILLHFPKFTNGKVSRFDAATGVRTKLSDFVKELKAACFSNTKLDFGAREYRKNEPMDYSLDSDSLQKLGWKAKISIKTGIKKIVEAEGIKI